MIDSGVLDFTGVHEFQETMCDRLAQMALVHAKFVQKPNLLNRERPLALDCANSLDGLGGIYLGDHVVVEKRFGYEHVKGVHQVVIKDRIEDSFGNARAQSVRGKV